MTKFRNQKILNCQKSKSHKNLQFDLISKYDKIQNKKNHNLYFFKMNKNWEKRGKF